MLALVGVTLGLIPLLQRVLTGTTGSLWQLVPGGGEGPLALGAAIVVLLGAIVAVLMLERAT